MKISILKQHDRYCLHWIGLAVLFVYLSLDEATAIHENMKQARIFLYLDTEYFLYNDVWIILGADFIAVIGLLYSKFLWALPKQVRMLFLASAGVYILGALGMEIVGGYWQFFHGKDLIHAAFTTLEELLEMLGVVLFIDTLWSIIASKPTMELSDQQRSLPSGFSGKKISRSRINRF